MLYFLYFLLFIFLFICGMTVLRTGLFNLSADSLKNWLIKFTDSPWKGLLIGIVITCILQSSSAVMVITIGLISARILTFPQSIGIILGTNIGTTFTAEFITIDIDSFIIPMAVSGAFLILLRKSKVRSLGLILLGISSIFAAMKGFEYLASPISEIPYIKNSILLLNESYFFSVMTGSVFTGIVQSSTATTGIIMGFLEANILHIDTGIALMLGANIGTCITALIAAIGSGEESRLSAYAHVWLNVLGVILFFPLIGELADLGGKLAVNPEVQLAHISVVFNVISSLMVLPFAKSFGLLILKLHGKHAY